MIHRSFDFSFVHDIGSVKSSTWTKFAIEAYAFFFSASGENYFGTFIYEESDSCLTNSAGTTGDEGDLSI
jgi:hypothetical protein